MWDLILGKQKHKIWKNANIWEDLRQIDVKYVYTLVVEINYTGKLISVTNLKGSVFSTHKQIGIISVFFQTLRVRS